MTLATAHLVPGLLLLALGVPMLLKLAAFRAALLAFPRSLAATYVFFGSAAAWFLYTIWHLSPADFGEYRHWIFGGGVIIAVLSFKCVPDFLAVRGVCGLVLMGAMPLLDAAFMEYDKPRRLFMVTIVYLAIAVAVWLGAQPWRARDFLGWLFARPNRARLAGAALSVYGLLLVGLTATF
jgi:hypothetical protein